MCKSLSFSHVGWDCLSSLSYLCLLFVFFKSNKELNHYIRRSQLYFELFTSCIIIIIVVIRLIAMYTRKKGCLNPKPRTLSLFPYCMIWILGVFPFGFFSFSIDSISLMHRPNAFRGKCLFARKHGKNPNQC